MSETNNLENIFGKHIQVSELNNLREKKIICYWNQINNVFAFHTTNENIEKLFVDNINEDERTNLCVFYFYNDRIPS